ncbi:MAG: ATP-binding protein, partial [Bacteroidales bacterium]|nr:ATP-binding protein [Bacteroidales bacterium]
GTEQEEGTGLGLILSKEFIDLHNGEIMVESQIGKGSTFTFTLPV